MSTLKIMGIIYSFKFKNHLIQVNRTYAYNWLFIIRHDYYKKIHLKLFRDIFHFWKKKKKKRLCFIISFVFICIFWFILLSLIIKHTFLFLLIEPIFCLPSFSPLRCIELYYWFKYLCYTPWNRTIAWDKENNI